MFSIFNYDKPLGRFLAKLCDVLMATLMWTIFSVPVVTIGASTTALYYVILKIVKDEDENIMRSFLKSFAQNFKQATIIWLIMLLVLIAVVCNVYFYMFAVEAVTLVKVLAFIVGLAVMIIWIALFNFIFSLLARFENTTKQILHNACYMAIVNYKVTLLMVVIDVIAIGLGFLVFPLIGIAAVVWANAYLLHSVFDKYLDYPEESLQESNQANEK